MASQPKVKTPRSAVLVVSTGGTAALLAAAAVSFQGLTGLGSLVGIAHPWLLPIAIDIYAATSTLVALLLPPAHPARRTAVWNARLGLAMSMAGNAADRAMHLGSYTAADGFLTFVGAWPSAIVERLLHLQGCLATDATATAAAAQDATISRTAAVRRETAGRIPVSPAPGAPVAPPARVETPAVARDETETADVTPRATAAATMTPPKPKTSGDAKVDDAVLALIATCGADAVTGDMVAEAIGKSRATGFRQLARVKEGLADGTLALPDAAPRQALAGAR